MNNTESYEKIIKIPNKGRHLAKKISLAMSYVLFFSIFVLSALNNLERIIPLLAVGVLLTFTLFAVTWKYVQIEYEYAFECGALSVAKIYGKRKRKLLVSAEIKEMSMIAPATEENIKKAEKLEIDERIIAVSSDRQENIWLALTGGKDEKKVLLFFEADERALSILKSTNPYVFAKK